MKRLLAGGCALGFAGAGLVAFASPGSAGDPPAEDPGPVPEFIELEAAVTPAEPVVGEDYTIAPVDSCKVADPENPGELAYWIYRDNGTPDDYGDDTEEEVVVLSLEADGSWPVIELTSDVAENVYFDAGCYPPDWEERGKYCFDDITAPVEEGGEEVKALTAATEDPTSTVVEEPPFDCVFEWYGLVVGVGDAPPQAPRPAKPTPGEPPYTG